jgi:hypothetical protein
MNNSFTAPAYAKRHAEEIAEQRLRVENPVTERIFLHEADSGRESAGGSISGKKPADRSKR